MDLLVVLGVAGLLLLVQLAWAGKAHSDSRAAVCLSNHRQLAAAWVMYAEDNGGRLAPLGNGGNAGKTIEDASFLGGWLDFQAGNLDNINPNIFMDPEPYENSAHLSRYLSRSALADNPFRCPSDPSVVQFGGNLYPRVRSYSANDALGGRFYEQNQPDYHVAGRLSEIVSPTPDKAFLMLEEHPDSINDGTFFVNMEEDVWIDLPASYHNGGMNLSFADGHVETWFWRDERTLRDYVGDGSGWVPSTPSPDNVDLDRVRAATTVVQSQGQ